MLLRIYVVLALVLLYSFSIAQDGVEISSLHKSKTNSYIDQKTGELYSGIAFDKYPNGQIGMKGQISNGKFEGLWTWWYQDGSKKRQTTYKNGLKTGYSYWWYKNGVKKSEIRFASNKNVEQKRWNEKGKQLPNPKLGRQ